MSRITCPSRRSSPRRLQDIFGKSITIVALRKLVDGSADGFAEGLVRREGGKTFGLRVDLVSQEVNQTQRLTLRLQQHTDPATATCRRLVCLLYRAPIQLPGAGIVMPSHSQTADAS